MITSPSSREQAALWTAFVAVAWGVLSIGLCGCGSKPPPPPAAVAPPTPVAVAPTPTLPPSPPATPAAEPLKNGPLVERAGQLREAARLLEEAERARERDARSYAENLFSSAELIVGSEALAELAPLFRQGAPPRVQTPVKQLPKDTPPQPVAVGNSEKDRPEARPKPKRGTLTGTIKLGGKDFSGEFGVVTLQPVGKNLHAFPTARIMEQRNRTFAPHVLVVPVGSVVTFPNFDPVFHNVFSASDTKPFDLGLYKTGDAREVAFEREGTVRLACNLHANMSAYIVVVSAPHYVVSDPNGAFRFNSLEPGKYTLKAYSERSTAPYTTEIAIKAGQNQVTVGVTDDAPTGPQPDKFGVARAPQKS